MLRICRFGLALGTTVGNTNVCQQVTAEVQGYGTATGGNGNTVGYPSASLTHTHTPHHQHQGE